VVVESKRANKPVIIAREIIIMVASSSFLILEDGRKLGFIDYGNPNGLPIILLHGTPGSRVFGFENEPLLINNELRIITPERPGYGLSDSFQNRTINDFSHDIEQLANSLNIDKFHVAGVSGGGPYVLACAYCLPSRVLSATLIASATPTGLSGFFKGMSLGNKVAFILAKYMPFLLKPLYMYSANLIQKHPEKLLQGINSQLCSWDQQVLSNLEEDGKIETFIYHIREAYQQGYLGAYSDMMLLTKPWGIDFQALKLPIFMWHGESDTLMPISSAKSFSKILPNPECFFIKQAGHLLLESDEYSQKIIDKIKHHAPNVERIS